MRRDEVTFDWDEVWKTATTDVPGLIARIEPSLPQKRGRQLVKVNASRRCPCRRPMLDIIWVSGDSATPTGDFAPISSRTCRAYSSPSTRWVNPRPPELLR